MAPLAVPICTRVAIHLIGRVVSLHCQLTHEMPVVGQGAGARALANQLQNALPPLILGTGRGLHLRNRN